MKADTVDLAAIFGAPVTYLVPMFQRPYVWRKETEWVPLWEDISSVLERQLDDTPANDAIPHFLGAVVLDQVLNPTGKVSARYVIDGQQRLTTLQLFIAAARAVAVEQGLDGPPQMLGRLLFNESFLVKSPEDRFKVRPTTFDRVAFETVVGAAPPSVLSADAHRMQHAFEFFREAVRSWAVADQAPDQMELRFDVLSTVLWKLLLVVVIDLDQRDNAQVIFETLNARGTPLLAADLIKNHVFQVAASQGLDIDDLYATYWQPLDADWWRVEIQQGRLRRPRLDIFMNHYLAMTLGREVVSHRLFPDFKRYLADRTGDMRSFLTELSDYARVYETFEREPESPDFGLFLYRLNTIEVTTAYPTLLWMCGSSGIKESGERLRAARVIEGWLMRRVITRGDNAGYTTIFLSLLNRLREAAVPSAAVVEAYLRSLEGERGYWPTDDQVREKLRMMPVYTVIIRARLRLILEAIEGGLRRAGFTESDDVPRRLTIEHVLPQEWHENWPVDGLVDQADAFQRRDHLKHTIGNLTLLTKRMNPALSNSPWETKRQALKNHSILLLSRDVFDVEMWDEASIEARTNRMADIVTRIWSGPTP